MDVQDLLRFARENRASDVHLIIDSPPLLRIDGALRALEGTNTLRQEDINQAFEQVTTDRQREIFTDNLELDFAYFLSGVGHLRCNACLQQGSISLALRLLAPKIPTIDELGLPQVCKDWIRRPRGLIVVTGPTGSGKSTTLASMIQHLNNTERRYVVTIEDPVEYRHVNNLCAFSQRELGEDTLSFANALKYVLRQDPDVILVGEMRDLETVATVLTVAETGHLILSTGHAPSAAQSVDRIVDLFPPHERPSAQSRLASVLLGVLSQALVPRIDSGRTAAVEIMMANTPVKNLIREGKTHLIPNTIRTNSQIGMRTLDMALVELFKVRSISWDTALAYSQDPAELVKLANEAGIRA